VYYDARKEQWVYFIQTMVWRQLQFMVTMATSIIQTRIRGTKLYQGTSDFWQTACSAAN
jgi:hypothetical protein